MCCGLSLQKKILADTVGLVVCVVAHRCAAAATLRVTLATSRAAAPQRVSIMHRARGSTRNKRARAQQQKTSSAAAAECVCVAVGAR